LIQFALEVERRSRAFVLHRRHGCTLESVVAIDGVVIHPPFFRKVHEAHAESSRHWPGRRDLEFDDELALEKAILPTGLKLARFTKAV
jgi:hypothetical protein